METSKGAINTEALQSYFYQIIFIIFYSFIFCLLFDLIYLEL